MATKLRNTVRNKTPADLLNDEVDLTISKQVIINADIRFKRLVRIDGRFEGKLIPSIDASIIITRRGHYLGDIVGLNLAYIDGKVEGNISVHALELGPHANVCGNILCKRIVIAGHSNFTGELNVSPSNIIPPPPPVPTQQTAINHPESGDDDDDDTALAAKEAHLVEDDDKACASIAPPQSDNSSNADTDVTKSLPIVPRKTSALIIHEPQVDLLASSKLWPEIESPESAEEQIQSIQRLATWIQNEGSALGHILVLLDIHYKPGLNDYLFWKSGPSGDDDMQRNHADEKDGNSVDHPEIGTVITIDDIVNKRWIAASADSEVFVQEYLLDSNKHGNDRNEAQLVMKPKHCQIGSTGAAVVDQLNKVLSEWSKVQHREVSYLVSQHRVGGSGSGNSKPHIHTSSNWVYDRNQIEHLASQVDRVFLAGQVLGHCHGLHLVADLAAGMVETLGVSDDKEITILTDALLVSGPTKQSREDMMDEVVAASQVQQVLLSTTEDALLRN